MEQSTIEKHLPDDIKFEILSRLPVKSLLRFRCVRKSWNSLITSRDFIAAHNKHHSDTKNSEHLLYMLDDPRKSKQVCTFLRVSDAPPPSYIKGRDLLLRLGVYEVVGVCEGLICLRTYGNGNRRLFIWNPFVGILKIVPRPPSEIRGAKRFDSFSCEFGFGFSKRSNDYKVVKLKYGKEGLLPEVEMYSLGENKWRIIECNVKLRKLMMRGDLGVFFEGSIYWLEEASSVNKRFVLRFDVDEEIFDEMEAPPFCIYENSRLVVVNGFLVCLEVTSLWDVAVNRWVKTNESAWSWTSTSQEFVLPEAYKGILKLKMDSFSRSGQLVYVCSKDKRRFFVYDYDNATINDGFKLREMKNVLWKEESHLVRVRETLVLLDEKSENEEELNKLVVVGGGGKDDLMYLMSLMNDFCTESGS